MTKDLGLFTWERFRVEPYQYGTNRPVPDLVHLESRSRMEPNQKVLV